MLTDSSVKLQYLYGYGFDLQLMSWGDGSGVPASGNNLVIVGIDNNNLLHIRIYDAAGTRITDTDETQLPAQAAAIATLKQQLPGLLPPHVLTDAEKAQVIAEATSIVGQTTLDQPDAVITKLSSVQNFSRRMGISYEDLISILQTTFINPNAVLIPRLRHLGVPFKTLHALNDGSMTPDQFKALLPADLDARKYGGNDVKDLQAVVNWVKNPTNYNRIKRLIVIDVPADAPDQSSAASLELRFCDPDINASKLHEIDFIRLIRFIRLWRKLGLTIAQTDDIITAPLSARGSADRRRRERLATFGRGFRRALETDRLPVAGDAPFEFERGPRPGPIAGLLGADRHGRRAFALREDVPCPDGTVAGPGICGRWLRQHPPGQYPVRACPRTRAPRRIRPQGRGVHPDHHRARLRCVHAANAREY